ncbi:MAG: F0F1 ATP synthase subunit B [Flammeovirgaceae bacterium]
MILLAGIVTPQLGLIFWTSLFFIIVFLILGKFAFKPIAQALEDRNKSIEDALASAEKAKEEMASLTAKNEELLREARSERDKILTEARTQAKNIVEEAQAASKVEADKIIKTAQEAIESEKNKALSEVKNQVAAISLDLAEKVLRKELADKASQENLVEGYLKDINLN